MQLQINYNLGDHGWADLHISLRDEYINMTVSYLHDTLAELISAANLLLKGAPDAKVIAMDEPGEHGIYLQVLDKTAVEVEIRWFKDWASWNIITEKEFEVVFKCRDTILNFSTEVFDNATRILNQHGLDGYKEKWMEHDFPIEQYNRLKSLLTR